METPRNIELIIVNSQFCRINEYKLCSLPILPPDRMDGDEIEITIGLLVAIYDIPQIKQFGKISAVQFHSKF